MKIIINGIGGRMSAEVLQLCREGYHGAEVVSGIDTYKLPSLDLPLHAVYAEAVEKADCVVDFSHHSQTPSLLAFCTARRLPLVLATTGHTDCEKELIREAAKKIPLFYSANMSLGVALLCELARLAARTMPDADIEIVETHHNRKLDAPSGTALMLADSICEERPASELLCGRNGHRQRRREEIGIHAIRMGNIVGTHEVIVGTDSQTVTLRHEAHTRALFAEGAIVAAEFIKDLPAGLYNMKDMIKTK